MSIRRGGQPAPTLTLGRPIPEPDPEVEAVWQTAFRAVLLDGGSIADGVRAAGAAVARMEAGE